MAAAAPSPSRPTPGRPRPRGFRLRRNDRGATSAAHGLLLAAIAAVLVVTAAGAGVPAAVDGRIDALPPGLFERHQDAMTLSGDWPD